MAFFKSSKGKVKTADPAIHVFSIMDIDQTPRCRKCGVTQQNAPAQCSAGLN